MNAKLRAQQRKLANGNGTKQSPVGRMPAKGSLRQRLHPGMLSSLDRATAHYGAVTGLKATEDGMYLLSAGRFCLSNLCTKYSCVKYAEYEKSL